MFLKTPFWDIIFHFMLIFQKTLTLGTPYKSSGRQNGTPNRSSGTKIMKTRSTRTPIGPTRETLKHWETPSGLNLIVLIFFVVLHSPICSGPSKSSGRQSPPTLAGVRRCQTNKSRAWLESSSIRAQFGFQMASQISILGLGTLKPPQIYLFAFWARLLAERRNIKKTSLPKSINISKNATLDAQGFNVDDLLAPFGFSFSINFRDHPNLLNCNNYNAKHFYYNLRPPILA